MLNWWKRPKDGELYIRRKSIENYTPKSYDEVLTILKDRYGTDGDLPDAEEVEYSDFTEAQPDV